MTDGPGPTGQRTGWPPDETAQRPVLPPDGPSASPPETAPGGPLPGTPVERGPVQGGVQADGVPGAPAGAPPRGSAPAPERTLPPPPAPEEPSGPSLGDRLQARLAKARDEHKRNAAALAPPPRRAPSRSQPRRPARRARLRLTRVDPWSVMKTAFLLSIAFGVVTVVSVLMVWSVLGAAGVWDSINATVQNVLGESSATQFDVENYLGTSRVLGFTLLVSVIDVVLLTAIATLGAFLYNMAAALLGGIEVTLAEEGR